MRILFITNIKDNSKGGLFLSVTNRTSNILKNYKFDGKVISVIDNETKFCKFIKHLLNKDICSISSNEFIFTNVKFKYLYNNINIINAILSKFSLKYKSKKLFNTIKNEIDLSDFSLIQAHWAYPIGYAAKMIKDKYGIPYVLTVHGSDIHTMPFKYKKYKKYVLDALNGAAKVIFVSKNLLDVAKTLGYSGENAVIIPNGVDTEKFKILPKKQIKEETALKEKIVGYVGDLVEVKRADKLPEIFKYIHEIDDTIQFLIVGEGVLKESIIAECRENNLKAMFTGRVESEKVVYYMNLMDTMILPSRNEGWGSVILEANACGVPVVGSSNGGIPEAISHYGIVVDEGKSFEKRFAEAVIDSLNHNYDDIDLRKRALQYNWSKISIKEYDIYMSVLNNDRYEN